MPTLNDLDTAAKTIAGEARGEDYHGQKCVAYVILNRVKKRRLSVSKVCKQRWQFSCWNKGDSNKDYISNLTSDSRVYVLALMAFLDAYIDADDPTRGALHYMTKARRRQGWPASWGQPTPPCYEHDNHLFYNNIDDPNRS